MKINQTAKKKFFSVFFFFCYAKGQFIKIICLCVVRSSKVNELLVHHRSERVSDIIVRPHFAQDGPPRSLSISAKVTIYLSTPLGIDTSPPKKFNLK